MTHPIDIHVGSRLRHRRESLRLSHSALASKLGIKVAGLIEYELGLRAIPPPTLFDIAQILNTGVNYFFDIRDEELKETCYDCDVKIHDISHELDSFISGDRSKYHQLLELIQAFFGIKDEEIRGKILDLMRSFGQKNLPEVVSDNTIDMNDWKDRL
ncbi:MAG: hypothetical protein B7Z58_18215 [Acidiphilium sp. 37-64-53]|uniref:helix-turn-helix domain-containing protein n=1 Tax=Acidiphilium sp. 37-64-53 TaxID=1970299 RepID=UPI000BCCDBB3|nr:helix-turn-helix transcriptional regulator [Acidiphilium sp. 37-64-53]OYV99642.1 MAG: hypothetical protein B7Z58_18215 [Acidiphilium sp. 37-64-53]HQT82466.1 helix-turn-helix transcriptional regulator [Ferrovaceae bacterium]